jgi:outer membrane protein TolC
MNHFSIFFATALLPGSIAFATIKLNWQDSLVQFKKNNPSIKSSDLILKSSELKLKGASSGYWPQMSLNANSVLSSSSQSTAKPKDTTTGIAITQNLFSGFATEANLAQAQANILTSKAEYIETYSSLIYDLKTAYIELLYCQKTNKLLIEIAQRRQQNYDLVKLRFTNGKENKGALLLAEAYLKLAQFEKLQNSNAINMAQKKIKSLLDFEDDNIELTDELTDNLRPLPNLNENDNYQTIIENHPDHQKAMAQQHLADANLQSEKSSFFPMVDLQYSNNDFDTWATGVTLSWSLFDGGKDYYAVQSRIAIKTSNELLLIATDRIIAEKLNLARNKLVEANEKIRVDEAFLKAAMVREQISRSKYNNGLANFEDWDLVEADLIARQKNLLKSEREKLLSVAEWLKAQGKGATE